MLRTYAGHCNGHRLHQSRQQQRPPDCDEPVILPSGATMRHRRVLGGAINEYPGLPEQLHQPAVRRYGDILERYSLVGGLISEYRRAA